MKAVRVVKFWGGFPFQRSKEGFYAFQVWSDNQSFVLRINIKCHICWCCCLPNHHRFKLFAWERWWQWLYFPECYTGCSVPRSSIDLTLVGYWASFCELAMLFNCDAHKIGALASPHAITIVIIIKYAVIFFFPFVLQICCSFNAYCTLYILLR